MVESDDFTLLDLGQESGNVTEGHGEKLVAVFNGVHACCKPGELDRDGMLGMVKGILFLGWEAYLLERTDGTLVRTPQTLHAEWRLWIYSF